jgi:predicted ferric reductase
MTRSDELDAEPAGALHIWLPALALLAAITFALSGAGQHTTWYVVRAAGIVAYVLVALTVTGGLLISNRALPVGQPRVDVYEVHRFISLLAICGAGFHALTLLLDHYIGFSAKQILVPFTSAYRPVPVALGIMALYGAIAVYASAYAKRWLGYKGWRAVHYASFAVFTLATYHGILSGADTRQPWMLAIYVVAMISVMGLVFYRIILATEAPAPRARPASRVPPSELPVPDTAWRRPG